MGVNKVVFGETTLIDLTSDTITADALLKGYTAHGADGEPITGTMEATASVGVVSITTGGSYDSATYHGNYYAAIDANGNLLVVVNGGTSTSYEAIKFAAGTLPDGATLVNQSNTTDTSATSGAAYVGIFSGITASVNIELMFDDRDGTNDYTQCTVNVTEVS